MKIFISRTQFPDSEFRQRLEAVGMEVYGESLLDFQPINFEKIPEGDWLFFYRKSGVNHFFSQLQNHSISQIKIAAIGPGTAKALARVGQEADFVGNGVPEHTAVAFGKIAKGQTIIFVRAEHSKCSVQNLLSNQIQVKNLLVYENEERKSFTLPYCDILVFTSPMNARAYFSTYVLHDTQQVVAIGESTAEELRGLGVSSVHLPEQPNEEALAEVVVNAAGVRRRGC